MFGYNFGTLIIILIIALLLFGPKRLPELGESIGKAIKSFKQAHDEPESMVAKGEIPGNTPGNAPGSTNAAAAAAQTITCSQCHKEFSGEFAFCPHCGTRITKA